MVRAGLKAIYLSGEACQQKSINQSNYRELIFLVEGWQVAADANTAGDMYPDQSLYPSNSGQSPTQ
jgi:isocitrate lyase